MKSKNNILSLCLFITLIFCVKYSLSQKYIALNPSNQTSNTVCGGNTEEYYANIIADKTKSKLNALGYTVQIFYGGPSTNPSMPTQVNNWGTQVGGVSAYVSQHTNALTKDGSKCSGTARGSLVVYNKTHKSSDIDLATYVLDGLGNYLNLKKTGPQIWIDPQTGAQGNLGVLSGISSTIPCCLEEALFHDNSNDAAILRTSSGQDKIANGVATGIDNYLKNNTSTAPPNDNPCDAGVPTLSVGSSCSFTEGTNVGATNSSVPNVTCDGTSNGDVWYKFKVPSSGSVIIETNAGTINDMGMVLYTGSSCSSLSIYGCYENGSTYSQYMPRAVLTGLTPNATMWIRLYEYNNNNFGTFKICVTGSSSSNCSITSFDPNSITRNPESFSSSSGDDIIVNGQANCTFTVSESCSWLTVTPSSGTMNSAGQTFLNYSVQENSSTSSRSCTVNVNGSNFTIKQDGCTSDFGRATKSVAATGLTYDLDIDSYSPCSWNIQNNYSWIHLSQTSGTGYPTISVSVDANNSAETRIATLTIDPGNATHVITQQGIASSLTATPASLTLGSASNSSDQITVNSNVSWTASDDATWLSVNPAYGSNNRSITVTATSANPSTTNTRTGIVTISGGGITRTVTVIQASSSSSCTSPVAKVNNPRGVAPLTFTCETLGGSGGNIAYKWYKGTSCAGTVIGTGQTLTVNESGYFSCKAYIEGNENNCFDCGTGEAKIEFQVCTNWTTTPGTQNVPVSGGKYEFLVSSTGGTCSRNTKSNDSWIHSVNYIGGGYWEYTVDANNTGNARTGSISVNNLQDGINDIIRLTVTQAGPPPPPAITVSTTSLPDFGSVQVNSNSTAQSFTVSGSNLTNDISLTAPSGFEISRSSGSDYKSSLSLTQSGGTVASTTIYVRFKPASTGLKSGNIAIKSTGAETKNVTVSGTGTTVSPPTIAVSTTSLPDFGGVLVNSNSSSQSFTVSGSNLSANISLSAPSGFEISKSSGSNYGATLSLTQTSGTVSNTTIYVRFSPTSAGAKSGEISVSSTGVATKKVAVSGTGTTVSPPTISVSQQSFSFGNVTVNTNSLPQSFTVSGSNLTTNISLSAPTGFEISKSSGSDYRTTLGLTQLGGTVSSSTIYVRFSPTSTEAKSGDITVSSTGATTKKVAVSGTGVRVSDCNLALSSNGLEFTSSSGNKTVNVTSNSSWIVSDDATWITVTPTSGSNNGTLTISVSNNSGAERSGIVTVSGCNNTTKTIIVTQSGPCNFSLARSSLDFSASPGGKTFNVTSNSGWTVSEDSSWISALPVSSFGNKSISISVTENNGHSRTGVVTFSACNQLFYLTVNQVGKITSIGDVETNGEIKIYPNPTTGIITIEGLPENKEVEISIFDINRKLIKKQTSISSVTKMDISDVVSGNYLLIIDDVVDTTFKIIKK